MLKKLASDYETFLAPGPVCTFAISAWWSDKPRIIAAVPPIDEPEGSEMAGFWLAKLFE